MQKVSSFREIKVILIPHKWATIGRINTIPEQAKEYIHLKEEVCGYALEQHQLGDKKGGEGPKTS